MLYEHSVGLTQTGPGALGERSSMSDDSEPFDVYDEDGENLEDTYLTFRIDEEEYALPVSHVTEIIRLQRISQVPDMPDSFRGVLNLRGKVIPVMDVRSRFKLPVRDYDDRTVVVVLEVGPSAVGLVVDAVSEVVELPPSCIDPAPPTSGRNGTSAVCGMAKRADEVSILLDVERLMDASARVAANQQQLASA